jgi:hypothetical protein
VPAGRMGSIRSMAAPRVAGAFGRAVDRRPVGVDSDGAAPDGSVAVGADRGTGVRYQGVDRSNKPLSQNGLLFLLGSGSAL